MRKELSKLNHYSKYSREEREIQKKYDEQGFKKLDSLIVPEHREFKKFLKSLINIDPMKRPSAREALKHRFLNMEIPFEFERMRLARESKSTKHSSSVQRTSVR